MFCAWILIINQKKMAWGFMEILFNTEQFLTCESVSSTIQLSFLIYVTKFQIKIFILSNKALTHPKTWYFDFAYKY